MAKVREDEGRPGHRIRRRRGPLLLHRRHRASSSPATSSPRCSRATFWRAPGPTAVVYDLRASLGRARHHRGRRRHGRHVPGRATPSSSSACGEIDAIFAGEVSGHYYFRDFSFADTGADPGAAGAGDGGHQAAARCRSLVAEFRSQVPHLRRDQLHRRRRARPPSSASASATPTAARPRSTACRSTTTTGTSTCARRTPSRCCASTSSRSCRRPTWSAAATRCSR